MRKAALETDLLGKIISWINRHSLLARDRRYMAVRQAKSDLQWMRRAINKAVEEESIQPGELKDWFPWIVSWIGVLQRDADRDLEGAPGRDPKEEPGYWDETKPGVKFFFTDREYPEWSLREGTGLILSATTTSKPLTLSTIKKTVKNGRPWKPRRAAHRAVLTGAIYAALGCCTGNTVASAQELRSRVREMIEEQRGRPPLRAGASYVEGPTRPAKVDTKADLNAQLKKIPLGADLHRHLVGTGPPELWERLAKERGLKYRARDFQMQKGGGWKSFLKAFDIRDALKSDPDFMRELLRSNYEWARKSRVSYLELSTGPFLFLDKRLRTVAEEECRRSEQLGITMRFLLGIRREKYMFGAGLPSDPMKLFEQIEEMQWWNLIKSDPMIEQWFKDNTENIKFNELSKEGVLIDPLVVGVDLCGQEPGHSAARLFSASSRIILYSEGRLGLRLHAGEGVDLSHHLLLALRLAREFLPKVRFGHALGFAHRIGVRGYVLSQMVIDFLQFLLDRGLCLEANLTSNHCLLGTDIETHPLKDFLRLHWPVVLGTDDPSVWEVSELESEFELAIEAGLIETTTQLDEMVRNSIKHSFVEDQTKARLLNQVETGLALQ
jgi:adenosine deaminase